MPGYDEKKVSDNHLAFVLKWAETGDYRGAAETCGFNAAHSHSLIRSSVFASLYNYLVRKELLTSGLGLCIATLKEVMTDKGSPPQARVQAAKTMKEWVDEEERRQGGGAQRKDLSAMTIEELAVLIGNLEQAAQLKSKTLDITPDNQ